jgi:hypothetical protein
VGFTPHISGGFCAAEMEGALLEYGRYWTMLIRMII